MHLMKHADSLGVRGDFRIVGVNFWADIKGAVAHLERRALRQVAPVDPEEARRILLSVCPCYEMEHRMGVCPLGIKHRLSDSEGHNTINIALKKSIIYQMTGKPSPTNLLVTYVAAGTSSDPTDPTETTLAVETYRDTPTYLDALSDTQLTCFWYFGPTVANAGSMLHEWGIFGGGATSTPDSGIRLARFLDPFDKNMGTAASGNYLMSLT